MTYRVAQWNTGIVGSVAARAVIAHPAMELVACFAHDPRKVGADVGTLVGAPPVGVTATDDIDLIIAAAPDCVLYMPIAWNVETMVRLLEAGINIVATANFITGTSYGLAARERLREAAMRGGASLYGSGVNPGLINALALMATAGCSEVRHMSILESVDATGYGSAATWRALGFGEAADTPGLVERVKARSLVFIDAVEMMAGALEIELDEIRFDAEFGIATKDLALGYMDIGKGMICGLRMVYTGVKDGRSIIDHVLMWRLGDAMMPDWTFADGWIVEIAGQPDVRCTYHVSGAAGSSAGLVTAMPAVHAIPHVCAAPPGIVTMAGLPLVAASHCVVAR